jgi:uncharacterized protein (DUF2235 family)
MIGAKPVIQSGRGAQYVKRLPIFLDGTWNDPADQTNVFRLREFVAAYGHDGVEQVKPY